MVRHWDDVAPGELHRSVEGSMVFIDISGFTKMSERLARHGRVGAEEVSDVIAGTFGALLPEAYAYGASLLKFGGDAMLFFFTDEGHELRACAAAHAMQRTMGLVGLCVTSAGKVTLRMSVGIHSGEFDFFIAGESHREMLVAGPAASRMVETEAASGPGQILLSETTAAAVPRANRGRSIGPGFLLRGMVECEPAQVGPDTSPTGDLNQFIPVGQCDLLVGGEVEPEHRPAAVAFIHFHHFDELIEQQGPAPAADRLDAVVRSVQAAVDPRGVTFLGTDISSHGGKIILTAGAPSTTGQDEELMLLAVQEIVSASPALPLSAGVSWGSIFSGEIGTPYRRTYTVMGDVVNTAARLMARAPIGEVYATEETLEGSRTTFAMTALEPFTVKGKKLPLRAVSVGAPEGSKTHQASGLPLIGREQELTLVTDAWEEARSGSGQMVELSAEAGMGKSRLLEEFLVRADPDQVISSECRLYQAATPYFPFRTLLRQAWGLEDLESAGAQEALKALIDARAPELGPWLSLIGVALGLEVADSPEVEMLEDQFKPARTMASVDALLEATTTDPTVFIIEDTHWMDDASRELLGGLLAGLSRHPWLIVLTRRPGDDGFVAPTDPHITQIPLLPLGLEQAKELIFNATEDSPLPPQLVERLAKQAHGRPLFLVELLQTIGRGGSLDEIPQSVEAMIASRIDTLPLSDRNILRRLSVLGSGFQLEHTPAVLGDAESGQRAQTRMIRRLSDFVTLDNTGWIQFQHALIRDVAYAGLPFKTRQDLHARVADSIFAACGDNPEEFSELLSLHYFYAKRWSRSWFFSRMAGDRAKEIYANHEAAAFYERALDSLARLEGHSKAERVEVLGDLATVQFEAGSYEQAMKSLREAIRHLPDDPVTEADLRLKLARGYHRMGALSLALRETALGLKLVEGSDQVETRRAAARLRAVRAGLFGDQFRPRKALKMGLLAVEDAEASGELEALARAYTKIDEAYQILGKRDLAVHEERALEIFEELGDLPGILLLAINLGVQAYADGRWDDAIAMYSKAQDVARRSGNESGEGAAAANLGEVLISRGQLDEAYVVLQEARRVLRGQKVIAFALFAETQLGRLLTEKGDTDAAVSALMRVIEEAHGIGQPFFAVDASVHLADALARSGESDRALEVIEEAKELAGEDAALYEVPLERLRASALLGMNRPEEAVAHIEPALESAREQRLVYEEALLLLLLADATGDRLALEEAGNLLEGLGASTPQFHRLPSPTL
jgi:class 3 adenylate cyclase/tetratricopeptide (TPR) repeat protein